MSAPCLQCGIDNDLHIFDDNDPTAHEPWTARQEIELLRKQRDEARSERDENEGVFKVWRRRCEEAEAKNERDKKELWDGLEWANKRADALAAFVTAMVPTNWHWVDNVSEAAGNEPIKKVYLTANDIKAARAAMNGYTATPPEHPQMRIQRQRLEEIVGHSLDDPEPPLESVQFSEGFFQALKEDDCCEIGGLDGLHDAECYENSSNHTEKK